MLRQEIFVDIAIPLTWNILIDNPFTGEMYEGQLLELLIRNLQKNISYKDKEKIKIFMNSINDKINRHEWEFEEYMEEYSKLVQKISKLL